MPPRSARKSNPELIPTKDQTRMICKWEESTESLTKKKMNEEYHGKYRIKGLAKDF